MCFLFLLSIITKNSSIFRGNWTLEVTDAQTKVMKETNKFQFDINSYTNFTDYLNQTSVYGVYAQAIFKNTTNLHFPSMRFSFTGIADENKSKHFLIAIPNHAPIPVDKAVQLIMSAGQVCNESDSFNFTCIYDIIYQKNLKYLEYTQFYCVEFTLVSGLAMNKTFDLMEGMSGRILFNRYNEIAFTGQLFDIKHFIQEGLIFGVFTAITIVINFYGWMDLNSKFTTLLSQTHLSIHSYIMHIGFDFTYSLFFFDFSMQAADFLALYSLLFVSMILIYFGIQMKEIALIWRAHNQNINDIGADGMRMIFFKFFVEICGLMSLTSLCISAVFDYPKLCLPYLYSFFIPQIIHSAFTPGKKKGDSLFVILISIQRLFPVWYFTLYKNNILEQFCPRVAIYCTVYVVAQVIIILLQNRFGGNFFFPKSMRPAAFDYHSLPVPPNTECAICMGQIAEDDDVMVTPCHHAFHTECLSRWMDEQLICPICRAEIPPLVSNSS